MLKSVLMALALSIGGTMYGQSSDEVNQLKSVISVQEGRIAQLKNELAAQKAAFDAQKSQLDRRYCLRKDTIADMGYADSCRGWYAVEGCVVYCRWVGNSSTGGDPRIATTYRDSFWACVDGVEYRTFKTFPYALVSKYSS